MPYSIEKPGPHSEIETPDLIIKGGTLLTMAEGNSPRNNSSVLIKGDRLILSLSMHGAPT
jgi:hypothetical protein